MSEAVRPAQARVRATREVELLGVGEAGVLEVEAAGLGVAEEALDRPAFAVGGEGCPARPGTWVTERTGHMGYTFRLFAAGRVDAVEREKIIATRSQPALSCSA
jgi:hypothetical protein